MSFAILVLFIIRVYLHFQSFSWGRPWCCPTVDKYRTLLPQQGLDWRQVFVAPWCWRNPEEKGHGECRRRDSALKSSNHFKKSSPRCTFRARPVPWCCSIPPAPACEAQSKVMKAEKECQMITKSPRTPPYHGERRLAFYCQLHLPSLAAPNTITVLTRQTYRCCQLLRDLQVDLSLSLTPGAIKSADPSSTRHPLPAVSAHTVFLWHCWDKARAQAEKTQ